MGLLLGEGVPELTGRDSKCLTSLCELHVVSVTSVFASLLFLVQPFKNVETVFLFFLFSSAPLGAWEAEVNMVPESFLVCLESCARLYHGVWQFNQTLTGANGACRSLLQCEALCEHPPNYLSVQVVVSREDTRLMQYQNPVFVVTPRICRTCCLCVLTCKC